MQILQGDDVGIIVPLSLSVQVNANKSGDSPGKLPTSQNYGRGGTV